MSPALLAVVGCIYAYVGFDQYRAGNPGMAVMWLGYVLANCGFIYHILTKG